MTTMTAISLPALRTLPNRPKKRPAALAALLLMAGIGLSGCADGGPGLAAYGRIEPWSYGVWYDGYYGPIYDGYWGSDGVFYYRGRNDERAYRRGDSDHFRREAPGGTGPFRRFEGQGRPPQGMQAPNFPHASPPSHPPQHSRERTPPRKN